MRVLYVQVVAVLYYVGYGDLPGLVALFTFSTIFSGYQIRFLYRLGFAVGFNAFGEFVLVVPDFAGGFAASKKSRLVATLA